MSNMKKCPECKTNTSVKRIVYGMPLNMPKEEDNWVTGGCVLNFSIDEYGRKVNDSPKHRCTKCGTDF